MDLENYVNYSKKEQSIKFLYSIDILSETEMNDILNYLQGKVLSVREFEDKTKMVLDDQIVQEEMRLSPDMAIDEIENVSVRVYSCLARAGICYVGDLCKYTKYDLMKIRNLGTRGYKELMDIVKKHNIKIKNKNDILLKEFPFSGDTLHCLMKIGKTTVGELMVMTKEEAFEFVRICKEREVEYINDMEVFKECDAPNHIIDILKYPFLYEI